MQAVSFEGRELSFVQHLASPGWGPSLGNQVLCNTNFHNKKRRAESEEWPHSALRTVDKSVDFTKMAASPEKADLHLCCSGGQVIRVI